MHGGCSWIRLTCEYIHRTGKSLERSRDEPIQMGWRCYDYEQEQNRVTNCVENLQELESLGPSVSVLSGLPSSTAALSMEHCSLKPSQASKQCNQSEEE